MPSRLCAGPGDSQPCPAGQLIPAVRGSKQAGRCPSCRRAHEQAKRARRPVRLTYAEQQRRREAVAAHVALYGWWCRGLDGYQHDPHPSTDLTAHHVSAHGAGGSEHGTLVVICRSLNSAIGARTGT